MNRILIVEDDKDISRELKELLENSGYEAVVLTDFKNACDSIIAAEPDLVLLALRLNHSLSCSDFYKTSLPFEYPNDVLYMLLFQYKAGQNCLLLYLLQLDEQ